jgi:hypothetical protein
MFGSSLPPVVCRRTHVLFMCLCVCMGIVVSYTYCFMCFCFVCHLLVYPMLTVSLDCPSLIAPTVFSKVIFGLFVFVLCTLYCQFLWIVLWLALRFSLTSICFVCLRLLYPLLSVSLDFRETVNKGYTRRRQTKQINVREYRRANQRWTIQRNRQ